jgi:tetratricopeptide (TPR) repeat protein
MRARSLVLLASIDFLSQAVTLLETGRSSDAAALLEPLCSQEPGNARAWFLLGASRHVLRDYERALEALDRSLELEPDNRQAFYAALAVLCDGKKPGMALERCEQRLRQSPGDTQLRFSAGAACEALGDMESALRHYEHAISIDPRCQGALQNRGIVLTALGRADEAVQSNRQFVGKQRRRVRKTRRRSCPRPGTTGHAAITLGAKPPDLAAIRY